MVQVTFQDTNFFAIMYYISKFCLLGYIEQAPEHSYIDVNNYKSVEELANYLKYLTNHTVSSVNKYICYVTKYILKKNHYVGRIQAIFPMENSTKIIQIGSILHTLW